MLNFLEKFDTSRVGIANQARLEPQKPAIIMGDVSVSYGELDSFTNAMANGFLSLGVRPGDRIAVLLRNCPEYLMAWTAAGKIAVTPVGLNYRFKSDELAYIINDSEAKLLIYGEALEEVVQEAKPKLEHDSLDMICVSNDSPAGVMSLNRLLAENSTEPPRVDSAGYGVAPSLIYTSGTTGRPKGVVRGVKNRLNSLLGYAYSFESGYDDTMLVPGPLYHSAPFAWAAFSLVLGNTLVIMPRFDAEEFLRLIQTHRVNTTIVVPTMLNRVVNLPDEVKGRYDLSSLRVITAAAESFPFPLKKRTIDFFGEGKLFEFYGATEISVVTRMRPEDQLRKPGSCGTPAMGSHIRLLDEDKQDVPVGEVGILYVKSPFLLDEYLNNPEATRAATHEGYFTVGDMARVDEEGFYYIVDRAVDMIISGGVNIYPAEIEEVLYRHPDVFDVGIIGVPDTDWGEKIVAYVVRQPGAALDEEGVVRHVSENLASYKKPREVIFVDELPYSPSGKLLKRELREMYKMAAERA
ncbi:MAG: AMP-binding protein [Deltaproteobacteria bacterium]|nr:AMP-binding protein [Deltaproteobacteria bacterium]MBW1950966.1 AMP-binding protein [Deltaproteobacteria bacterium]MBW2009198.1 AMP-binding protein [Deltaproteobacteria bacterium]MBW2348650.1 AMP-binding protein [Deltaproteobacteria bacterium]